MMLLETEVGLQYICCMGWGLGVGLVKTAETKLQRQVPRDNVMGLILRQTGQDRWTESSFPLDAALQASTGGTAIVVRLARAGCLLCIDKFA